MDAAVAPRDGYSEPADWKAEIEQIRAKRAATPRLGFGERPALLLVDLQTAFVGSEEGDVARVLANTAELVRAARPQIPVVYVTLVIDSPGDLTVTWRSFHDLSAVQRGEPGAQVDPRVAPEPGEVVVEKTNASGFFGTNLHDVLQGLGVDTLLVAGTSTSGCVRATVLDASAHSYRVMVVEECCHDSRPVSREAALWDMADRYADVVSLEEALDHLQLVSQRAQGNLAANGREQ